MQTTTKNKTALVLGATGGLGSEVARQLADAGWSVRALHRNVLTPAQSELQRGKIAWLRGDAMNRADVCAAVQGCSAIVHAVNPPGYRHWDKLVLPMVDNTIAAAQTQGATIVLPGTVYNFGPDALGVLHENSPQHPHTRKGAIRTAMEQRLRDASNHGCQTIVVRAGDFFGPRLGGSWFSQGLIQPGKPVAAINLPGAPGVGHQWSYVPDVARTMVELLDRRQTLASFSCFHMAGHWDADGTQMASAIRRVVERHCATSPKTRPLPWGVLRLVSPLWPTMRELLEMRYLWMHPLRMDNSKLLATLGYEPHTPLDEAVEASLRGLGCLPHTSSRTA